MAPIADALLAILAPVLPYLPESYVSWKPSVTPLSTWPAVSAALVMYLSTIFGIQSLLKDQQPKRLNTLFQVHNVFLCLGSGILLVLMVEEIAPIIWKYGVFYAFCGEGAWTPRLEFYYIVNYAFKYVELIDTVFLALKKKPLTFLHVFHHSATAALCFTQLNGKTSVSWVVISLNLAVHVLMYYYYYATAGGAKIWWKKYITTMQIAQFVIDLFSTYFATYSHFAYKYAPSLPVYGDCSGAESAALTGCGLLTWYLVLFIQFYRKTYQAEAARKANSVNGTANGKDLRTK